MVNEADVKFQGDKPLNKENRRKNLLETHKELTQFLRKEKGEKLFLDARKRAEDVSKNIVIDISKELKTMLK